MGRNLKYQCLTAINASFKPGVSKHSAKRQKLTKTNRIFSYSDRTNLINLSSSFCNYMKVHFPEVKLVKNIKETHINQFLLEKSKICSSKTLELYKSNFKKLGKTIAAYYHCEECNHWELKTFSGYSESIRNISMSYGDYLTLLSTYNRNLSNNGFNSIYLSYSFGCRVSELAKLKGNDILIDENGSASLRIIDSKGRRSRVSICCHKNMDYLKQLQAKGEDRIIPIQKESINKNVRTHLQMAGLALKYDRTCIHAIRKLYAQTIFNTFRNEGKSTKEALNLTSHNLGHGDNRLSLMQKYIQEIW